MSRERNPKRIKHDTGIDLLISASNIVQPTDMLLEIKNLENELFHLHRQRSKLYFYIFDINTHNLLKAFSNGLISNEVISNINKNVMKEVDILKARIIDLEHKIQELESLFKNE